MHAVAIRRRRFEPECLLPLCDDDDDDDDDTDVGAPDG